MELRLVLLPVGWETLLGASRALHGALGALLQALQHAFCLKHIANRWTASQTLWSACTVGSSLEAQTSRLGAAPDWYCLVLQ